MKQYSVTIPIAGHYSIDVEADNEEQAKVKAYEVFDKNENAGELQWEFLTRFCKGNVCYCPSPWEIDIEKLDSPDDTD